MPTAKRSSAERPTESDRHGVPIVWNGLPEVHELASKKPGTLVPGFPF
jgi:hypothetical protein